MPELRTAPDTQNEQLGIGWYAAALVLYIVIAYFFKAVLLNWIMGPLFMLITLYIVPALLRGLRDKVRMRSTG